MPIKVICPHCRKSLNAPDNAAGRKACCPKCGGDVEIPSESPQILTVDDEVKPVVVQPPPLPSETARNQSSRKATITFVAVTVAVVIGFWLPGVIVSRDAEAEHRLQTLLVATGLGGVIAGAGVALYRNDYRIAVGAAVVALILAILLNSQLRRDDDLWLPAVACGVFYGSVAGTIALFVGKRFEK